MRDWTVGADRHSQELGVGAAAPRSYFFAVCDYDIQNLRRLDPQQLQGVLATGVVFYLVELLGAGALLLQFFNVAMIDAFRPFFTGIVVHLLAAIFQFARIILLPPEA